MNNIVWQPSHPNQTQMWSFMHFIAEEHQLSLADYQQLHTWSIQHPALFWQSLCSFFNIQFDTEPTEILQNPHDMLNAKWFVGATFNYAKHLLTRRDEHPAIVSINEDGQRKSINYKQLYHEVAKCAAGLKMAGVSAGDRVAAIMPNNEITIIAMLATASIGAIWSSCSSDFGAQAAIDRLGQIDPKILFACDGHQYHGKQYVGMEKIQEFSQAVPSLEKIIICPNIENRAATVREWNSSPLPHGRGSVPIYWHEFLQPATECEFVSLPFDHPLFILFSSGTTGKPKCIMHGAGGTLLQHIKELALHCDLNDKDNLCFYTTCGWMMWNWTVSALALGTTITFYEGSPTYPTPNRMFKLIEEEKITVFGTSPKFLSAVDKAEVCPNKEFDLEQVRCILSTGSPLLPKHYDYVYEHIKTDVQLSSISGGTDIISCFALGNPLLPVYRGELQCIGLGMAVEIYDEQGKAIQNARGELVCTKPFPSRPIGFWQDNEKIKYKHAYFERFPGIWAHGDFAEITTNLGVIIYGRSDAVLNPGGVRIGTAEIYRQVEKIAEVLDSIVIGQDWQDDVRIVLFVKLREGLTLNKDIEDIIRSTIRQNASPRHVPAKILQVSDIPRTMSGKIVELAVRQIVQGQSVQNLQSIANPDALNDYRNRVELQ